MRRIKLEKKEHKRKENKKANKRKTNCTKR